MEIFLVGGAVRDFLLAKMHGAFKTNFDEKSYWSMVEKDWVVVGSTPDELLRMNYRQVGKHFPVFLHPETQEEYALARTERKTSKGYTGFECYALPDVTLEEDLKRRDLTINAIAMRVLQEDFSRYEIIDPYNGMQDLQNKIFRHISTAFAEDPVRILRVARLATRFGDFEVESSTQKLMQSMVNAGEVDALVPERVWQEWSRALNEKFPWRFFEILDACTAKEKLFPEVPISLPKKMALAIAAAEYASPWIRLAIQLFDVSFPTLVNLIKRYRIPKDFGDFTEMVANFYPHHQGLAIEGIHFAPTNSDAVATEILGLFEKTDAFRRKERFFDFLTACDYLEKNIHTKSKHKSNLLKKILSELGQINNAIIVEKGFKGEDFANELRKIRLEKIEQILLFDDLQKTF